MSKSRFVRRAAGCGYAYPVQSEVDFSIYGHTSAEDGFGGERGGYVASFSSVSTPKPN